MYEMLRQRRGEIGLRMALGASGRETRALILRDGLSLAAVRIAVGLLGAAAAPQVMAAMLFGVTPFDLPTHGVAVVIFAAGSDRCMSGTSDEGSGSSAGLRGE